jgi:hypothetical protein
MIANNCSGGSYFLSGSTSTKHGEIIIHTRVTSHFVPLSRERQSCHLLLLVPVGLPRQTRNRNSVDDSVRKALQHGHEFNMIRQPYMEVSQHVSGARTADFARDCRGNGG